MLKDSIKSSLCLGKSEIPNDFLILRNDLWDVSERLGLVDWTYKLTKNGGLEKDDIKLHIVAMYHSYEVQWKISYFWSWLEKGHICFSANLLQNLIDETDNPDAFNEPLVKEIMEKIRSKVRLDDYKLFPPKDRDDIVTIEGMLIESGFF